MKVCFLTNSLKTTDGWGRYSVELINALLARGVEPIVITVKGEKDERIPAECLFPVLEKGNRLSALIANAYVLFKLSKKLKEVAIVHILTEPLILLTPFLKSKPIIINAIGTYSISSLGRISTGSVFRWSYQRAKKVIAISRYTAKRLLEELKETKIALQVIPLGVSKSFLDISYLPLLQREEVFVLVGHIKERKGVIEAIIALSEVKRKHPGVKLKIIGPQFDQNYLEKTKEVIEKLGIQNEVSFLGEITDQELIKLLSSVRGLVVPSINKNGHFEGLGLVHLEAHALGTPSIGSLDCGNEDIIEHGQNGYLVKQGNIQEITEAMERLLENSTWEGLSSYCRDFTKNFLWEDIAERYLDLYQEVTK